MNTLPLDFYNSVFRRFEGSWLSPFLALSGPFDAVARENFENMTAYAVTIRNGQIRRARPLCYYTTLEQGRPVIPGNSSIRNLGRFQIQIRDDSELEEDSPSACKLPDFANSMSIYLYLVSPKISKASEKLIDSMRILVNLDLSAPLTRQIQGVLERIVRKKTLGRIYFGGDHQFDERSTKLVLDLLKQDQFYVAWFSSGCNFPLKALIAEWRDNAHQMIGKKLTFKAKLEDQIISDFHSCTEDDVLFFRMYYPHITRFEKSKFVVLKSQVKCSSFWQSTTKILERLFLGPLCRFENQKSKAFALGRRNERAMYLCLSESLNYKTDIVFT